MEESGLAGVPSQPSEAPSEAPGGAIPLSGPPRSGRRWPIIATIGVVLLLIIVYAVSGAAAAAGPVSEADSALNSTLSHDQAVGTLFSNDPFKNVNFNGSQQDITSAKAALATAQGDIAKWQGYVNSDRAALLKARNDLQSSFLTLPESATINGHRRRVEAGVSAMDTAQKGINLIKAQLDLLNPFIDAIGGFVAIGNAANAHDLNGMETAITNTLPSMQKTMSLAQTAQLPGPLMTALGTFQKTLNDMQALVTAAKAGDQGGVQRYAAAVDADGSALDAIDQTSIDNAEKQLFQPLGNEYDAQMKIAANG